MTKSHHVEKWTHLVWTTSLRYHAVCHCVLGVSCCMWHMWHCGDVCLSHFRMSVEMCAHSVKFEIYARTIFNLAAAD
jgi:hypothetical protein